MALEVIYLEDQALFFMSKLRLEKTVQKLFQPQIQVETNFFHTLISSFFPSNLQYLGKDTVHCQLSFEVWPADCQSL